MYKRYTLDMPGIFPRSTKGIAKIYMWYALNIPEICPRYFLDIPSIYEIYHRYTWDIVTHGY